MAVEVEAGFKVRESKEEAEKILLDNGFVNTFKTAHTRDVYFGKDMKFEGKSEEEIKRSMVRLRGFENYVYSSAVGSYFIKCYINPNLYYNEKYLTNSLHTNITVTKHDKTSENEGYIEYGWTISKGNIAEQSCYSVNGGSIEFNTDNTVELKFGALDHDNYKDVKFKWEAMAAGTNIDGVTSDITGRFESIKGKNLSYQKFVLETDLATLGSTKGYYNLFIKISASGDDNWDPFEQCLLVQIYK